MQLKRKGYDGRLTRWQNLDLYKYIISTKWPRIRSLQKDMLLAGSLSIQDYLYDLNLTRYPDMEWISSRLLKAANSANAIQYWDQVDSTKLRYCIVNSIRECARIESYVASQNGSPLEETAGYQFNQKYNIKLEDCQFVLENELGFTEAELLENF